MCGCFFLNMWFCGFLFIVCVYEWPDACMSVSSIDCPLEGSIEYPEAGGFSIGQFGAAVVPTKCPLLWGHQPRMGPLLQGFAWENAGLPLWHIWGQRLFLFHCVLGFKVPAAWGERHACLTSPVFVPVFSRVRCLLRLCVQLFGKETFIPLP